MDATNSSALVLTTLFAVILSRGFCSRSPPTDLLISSDDQLPYHKNQRRPSFVSYSGSDDDVDLNSIRDLLEPDEQQVDEEDEEDEEEDERLRRRRDWLSNLLRVPQFSRPPQQTEFVAGRDRRAYAKKGRWQGFCFRRTRTGRRFPYICWRESDG